MAYDENQAQRIREVLTDLNSVFSEKKMFSGICFMVDEKMCCGTHIDKSSGQSLLLCRISESVAEKALEAQPSAAVARIRIMQSPVPINVIQRSCHG